jgi:hypothetical protein
MATRTPLTDAELEEIRRMLDPSRDWRREIVALGAVATRLLQTVDYYKALSEQGHGGDSVRA